MRAPKLLLSTLLAGVLALLAVLWSERVPAPRPASVAATAFSAERAWPTLTMLADTIGLRVTGTAGADRALEYLAAQARSVPGVEVEIQDVTGSLRRSPTQLSAYRTRNLLVRIPGNSRDAILVSSHYDSPVSSVGAVDAGVAVASMMEMIRNIAAAPKLPRTVIFNINGAEEQGLFGAHGFLRHPWMKDVRLFLDLESAGTANKAILFQTGPGHSWLAKRYARAAPHPYGTVLGQDIFQSGAIPSATDFEIYRDFASVPGIDIAFYRNGYAYHTQLDRTWNTTPGSLQHMGANALALTRALATEAIPERGVERRAVYYDVLGLTMLAYDDTTAVVLAVLAAILAIVAVVVVKRTLSLAALDIGLGVGVTLAGWLFGLAIPLLVSLVVAVALGRPHSWFAHPFLPFAGYAALALAPLLALHGWIGRRRQLDTTGGMAAAWAGALIVLTVLLLVLTFLGVGSSYVLLWWVGPGAAGLLLYARLRRYRSLSLLMLLPATVLTMQAAVLLLEFRSIAGRMPLAVPFDVVMASIVAVLTLLLCTLPAVIRHGEVWRGWPALGLVVVGCIALAIGAMRRPYSYLRPQRLAVSHRESADSVNATVRFTGFDYVGPRAALRSFEGADVVANGTRRRGPYAVSAPPAGLAPAQLTLLSTARDSLTGERTATFRLARSDAYAYQITLPAQRFVRWVHGDAISTPVSTRQGDAVAQFISAPDTGWVFGVVVRGPEPVTLTATAVRSVTTPATRDLIARLPDWTSAYATAQTRRTLTF